MGDTLAEGQKLVNGESLTSSNGAYTLTLQDDGNLVLASRGQAIWSSKRIKTLWVPTTCHQPFEGRLSSLCRARPQQAPRESC